MWQISNVNCIILPVLFLDKLEMDAGQAGSPDWPWTGGLLSQGLDSLNCRWTVIMSFQCLFLFFGWSWGGGGTGKNWFFSRETRSDIKFFIGLRDLFRYWYRTEKKRIKENKFWLGYRKIRFTKCRTIGKIFLVRLIRPDC
jgi:hypothetical protein